MRAFFAVAALAVVTTAASAQEIAIAPQLRPGDEFRLEVNRTRKNSARPQQDAKGTTIVEVKVVSATAEGIRLEWIPGETTFDNQAVAQDPLMGAASAALKGLRLRINLTAEGDPAALREMTRALVAKAGQVIPQEEFDKLPSMEMADDGKFVFDRSVGLMRAVIVNRRMSMGAMQQRSDGWEIRLLKSPAR
jgi:hypothetical protein